jgi:hypothetical protein
MAYISRQARYVDIVKNIALQTAEYAEQAGVK